MGKLQLCNLLIHPGISFQNLSCHGFVSSSAQLQSTVTTYALALPKYVLGLLRRRQPRQKVQILQGIEGLICPGEMLLVLGRPGSGCSTFLKILAGDNHGFQVSDQSHVNYTGSSYAQMRTSKGARIYLAETDTHFPELTVGETLEVASSARSSSSNTAKDVASLFNLDGVYETKIGDAMIRGVSGGEKRRTSLAEAFISGARYQFWDNSTRGLDSSTALRFIRILRQSTSALKSAVAVTLYQASEAMYDSFDKVILLYQGRQIFFGPVEEAVAYFTSLGFIKPDGATTPDFLTSLTNPSERQIRPGSTPPRSPDEFAKLWKQSQQASAFRSDIDEFDKQHPIDAAKNNDNAFQALYTVSAFRQMHICINRAFLRLHHHYVPQVSAVLANALLAIVIGTVYYNIEETTAGLNKRAVLVFFSLLHTSMTSAFDVIIMWAARPIVEKHSMSRYAFYHPSIEVLSSFISSLPLRVVESLIFHIPIYFMTNLRRSADAFFVYWLFMLFITLTMSLLFRMVGTLSTRYEQVHVPFTTIILLSVIYTGFVVPPGYMVSWLRWIRWINPVAYAYESLMINELDGRIFPCTNIVPAGPIYNSETTTGVCAVVGAEPGLDYVDGRSYLFFKYGYMRSHMWRNLGVLIAMMAGFLAVQLVSATYIKEDRGRGEILSYRKRKTHIIQGQNPEQQLEEATNGPIFSHDITGMPHVSENKHKSDIGAHGQPPSVFHWTGLNYEIGTKQGRRQILTDMNGWVQPGTLTVLMGMTGAGKTSLLDVLADRVQSGSISGDICVDGESRSYASFGRRVGYAQQEDIHEPTATVREALEFSALLRQSPTSSKAEKLAYVDTVLNMLDMTSYADAVVGKPGEGLNIEQRRRLTIAVEMVAKPDLVLFLDEPTSGLDSQTAWSICMLLRRLASNGQSILCTLHQPSGQLFALFDRLLLLGKGGQQLYFGGIAGSSGSALQDYLESKGAPELGKGQNPAEWIIESTRDKGNDDWAKAWDESLEKRQVLQHLATLNDTGTPEKREAQAARITSNDHEYAASTFQQLNLVVRRNFGKYWRDPVDLYTKFGLCISLSLANSLSFTKSPHDIQGFTDLAFSIFLLLMLYTMLNTQVITRLVAERDLFEARERRNKSYSWKIFIASNVLVELAWQTLASALFFVLWYYPTGVWKNSDSDFGVSERSAMTFVLIWLFCLFICTSSQAVAIAFPLDQTGAQITNLLYWFSTLFCGVLIFPVSIPRFWNFVYRASPFTYLVQALLSATLSGVEITCSDLEQVYVDLPLSDDNETCGNYLAPYIEMAGGYVLNPDRRQGQCLYCPLDTLGEGVGWRNVGILTAYILVNILAFFGFYWMFRVPKRVKG
ncbi:ABC-2 type transporter-domain-containing protein [Podospora fimiseda]|uniref:ABC-2 type transporter-domain-containing protein n=1 Tax=Podospora fimiseda TaxID=252190 RepID=A0AAN6YPF7_9PEZI|nr:ABC-2 type transporter-domain-containing protein [Podospora fimiseda]